MNLSPTPENSATCGGTGQSCEPAQQEPARAAAGAPGSAVDLATQRLQLQRLERLAGLGMLSANLAHEIKNALVPVKTLVDLLLEKHPDEDLAPVVKRELDRINALVGQMLQMSRPPTNNLGDVSVHEALHEGLLLFNHQAKIRTIQVRKGFTATRDTIQGDSNQLKQVFGNLFFNALDAMGTQGTLSVRTDNPSGDEIRVTISDTGTGIDPATAQSLFQPFVTTKPDGTGLGLTIARDIVESLGGTVSLESAPSKGTSFSITLPLKS